MKLADVYYTGPGRHKQRRGPSGERYRFTVGSNGAPDVPAPVESVRDAIYFAEHDVFRVEWTPLGRVAKASTTLEGPASGVDAMLDEWGYRTKQQLAKSLGLNAGGSEEEIEDRLGPEIERLQKQMEEL